MVFGSIFWVAEMLPDEFLAGFLAPIVVDLIRYDVGLPQWWWE